MLLRLDSQTGQIERTRLRIGQHLSFGLTATADRRRVFATSHGDRATYEIDPLRMRIVRSHPAGDAAGAVVPTAGCTHSARTRARFACSICARATYGASTVAMSRRSNDSAFTPDDRTLVTTSEDGGVLVWDVANGDVRERLEGHTGETYGLALSTSGATAYTAALDGRTIFWDIAGTRRLATPFTTGAPFVTEDDEFPKELAITPDGRSLAVAQVNGHVDLFSTRSMRRERTVKALRGFAAAVDVSPDGHTFAVSGEGGQLALLDARTLRPIGELKGMRSNSQAVTFSPDGKLVAAGELGSSTPDGAGGRVHVWDTQREAGAGAPRLSFRLASPSLAFSPDGHLLAAAGIEDRPRSARSRAASSSHGCERAPTAARWRSRPTAVYSRSGKTTAARSCSRRRRGSRSAGHSRDRRDGSSRRSSRATGERWPRRAAMAPSCSGMLRPASRSGRP